MKTKIATDKANVAVDFSRYLAILISSRKTVHIALSGGSTPKVVFDELAANFQADIDWSKVHLYWGDERCVPPEDDQSNYKMTETHLLSKIKIPKENVHRVLGEDDPEKEAARYAALLEDHLPSVDGLPQFDLVILGMGDDGHTASIFPHEIALWQSEKYCEVATHPDSGQKRITITGKLINNAVIVAFLVTGKNKAPKVAEIIHKKGSFEAYPAALVAPKSQKLLWFLDAEAAQGLKTF
ncbi:6-phosphogluconolactonase [Maribacter sp. 2-571]|uniref:6-phosphogluconolactonase n=1 Tax=Maribacter sp. 2-571 TaxID=3417569 RepID=UPI003D357187